MTYVCDYIKNVYIIEVDNLCKKNGKWCGNIKADLNIACHAHAAPMPFPCHAVPLRV
jgi:hypothetical protein